MKISKSIANITKRITVSNLLGECHSLINREMHIQYPDTVNAENDTVNEPVFCLIK